MASFQITDIRRIAWSPDGKRVAITGDPARIHVWDLATDAPVITHASEPGSNDSLAWSPDGKYILSVREDHFIQIQEIPPTRRGPTS